MIDSEGHLGAHACMVCASERDRTSFAPALFMKFTRRFGELLE